MVFEYYFMFPIAILIAVTAMSLGIGGAIFFSPVFIILFPILGVGQLSPADAFGAALLTEVFGFASGYIGYARRKLIDYKTGLTLLLFSAPAAIIGTILKRNVSAKLVLIIFAVGMWTVSIYTIYDKFIKQETNFKNLVGPKRSIIDAEDVKYEYMVCNQNLGKSLGAVGGLFAGLISVGIGETTISTLKLRCGLPMKIASGTSIFVVISTVLIASATDFVLVGIDSIPWTLVMFTVPGVIIGGQIGPKMASRINPEKAEYALIAIFVSISLIMTYIAYTK